MTRVSIGGAHGRMGQILQQDIYQQDNVTYVGSIFDKNRHIDTEIHNESDVIIDFSMPEGTQQLLQHIKKPLLICTTGHTASFNPTHPIPVLYAPNTSMGIYLLRMALKSIAPHIADADIDIIETHHKHKKDKPSGTALSLKETISSSTSTPSPISIHAIRSGSVLTEHEVRFNWGEEILVLKHQSCSRNVFASGAITLAKWLAKQKPGFYTMEDVFVGSTEQP